MKKHGWLTITVALALAVVMLWAVPTLAQGRGKGQWGQGGQGWGCAQGPGQGQLQGAGYNACPNYPAYQTGQGPWCNYPQAGAGRRGPRGGGRTYQPDTQPTTPPTQ
jgi:hypothetical protein